MKSKKIYVILGIVVLAAVVIGGGIVLKGQETTVEQSVEAETEETSQEQKEEEGVSQVGEFTTEDIFGESYTQEVFGDYDLTLVNAFATWCSPCVQEMPELEKLRSHYEEQGVKFNVVAVVMDAKFNSEIDEIAVENAKYLHEQSGVNFPYLIPDEEWMNGRLEGLEAYPESFFVDQEGNIVSEPYLGARPFESWLEVVEEEFENLGGEKS